MAQFFTILLDIILPVFIIMVIGYICQKKFNLHIQTLARLNIYFLVPGFIFVRLYEADIQMNIFLQILSFILIHIVILYVIVKLIAKLLSLTTGRGAVFSNSVLFYNSGNYGVPVNDLVFKSDPFAMSIQVVFLMFQNIFIYTYGIFSLQSVQSGKLRALLGYFKMPVIYALLLGLLLGAFNVPLPGFVLVPAHYVANAMIGLALFMLGAQVANIKLTSGLKLVYVSLSLRLLISPVLALGMIYTAGLTGLVAQTILIATAMPTSVNSAVIAEEYENHPDVAAQIVLFSTLFSAFTVTLFIYLAQVLF